MAKQFPDELYVKIEDDGDGSTYFLADADPEAHAEFGHKVKVGRYVLQSIDTLITKVEVR